MKGANKMKRFLNTAAILVFAFAAGNAQPIQRDSQLPNAGAQACNANFAESLVEHQVLESKSVVEPVKRIKILLRSADFLWKLDPVTARTYFAEAWKMANDRFKETGFEQQKTEKGMITRLPDQRMEVITAVSKHDAEWARKLSDQMLADFEKAKDTRKPQDETRELGDLLLLAGRSATTNPELSRQLFRRVMRYRLFSHWFFAFNQLGRENPELAISLYKEAMQNYRNESPRRLLFLSGFPFANSRILGPDKFRIGDNVGGLSPNLQLQRLFIETLFSRIAIFAASEEDINRPAEIDYHSDPPYTYQPEAAYMVTAVRELEPHVIEKFPDMLQRHGVAKSQAQSLMSADARRRLEERDKGNSNLSASFDEQLAAVEKAHDDRKLTDFMIARLVFWHEKTEEQFAKLEPWLDKVKEESPRKELINYFWFLRSKLAIKEKRFDDGEKLALKVPEIEHRALLMFDIAEIQSKNAADLSGLFDTLNRLSKLVRSADNSVAKAQLLLGLADMYQKVNNSVALDELSESIRVTNSLKDPNIFSNVVSRQIVGKEYAVFATFSTPGYDLEKTFEELGKRDFQMSISHANSLADKYFRTLAIIALSRNCIETAPTKAKPVSK